VTLAEKVTGGIITVALVTTLILPDRQTAAVLKALWDGFTGALQRAMGR
jgi:hypothetical protein